MSEHDQSTTDDVLPPGTVVAERFVVDGFLARGGFASVYRAHHRQIGRRLALKILEPPPRGQHPDEFRRRFQQEAQVAARIEHPGVVDVFDFGELPDGRMYLAMDLLSGHDLDHELRDKGPMPPVRAVPLFIECLAALAEGHRQGIVHKDLKPSNLFLVHAGEPGERLVILDFGIARVFEDPGSRITREGGFSGTPAYLAPEYIRHQVVGPPLDVYQMGLILIETLTGGPAIVADNSMAYMLAQCLEPARISPALAATSLGRVCLRAVAKEPADRYQDAGELRDALAGLSTAELIAAGEQDTAVIRDEGERFTQAKTLQMISLSSQEIARLTALQLPRLEQPEVAASATSPRHTRTALGLAAALLLMVVFGGILHASQAARRAELAARVAPPPVTAAPAPAATKPAEVRDTPIAPADAGAGSDAAQADEADEPPTAGDAPEPAPQTREARVAPAEVAAPAKPRTPRPRPTRASAPDEAPPKPAQPAATERPMLLSD